MKKLFTSIILTVITVATAYAQIADGFYYIKNRHSGRYMSIQDNDPSHYKVGIAGEPKLAGIRTYKNWSDVCTMPSCVIYIKNVGGNQYDFEAQGSSLYKLSGNKLYATLKPQGDGSYIGSGSYKGTNASLSEFKIDPSLDESWLGTNDNSAKYWIPVPVNTSDNYIGIKPDVKTNDGYFGTIYAGFAFNLASDGMKAYYISEASGSKITLKEISGTIPASTPVIIRCASNDPKKNKILPVKASGTEATNNKLKGVFCSCTVASFVNVTQYIPSTMRVIGVSGGKLAFVKASEADLVNTKYLKGNKAYLAVPSGSADVMTESGTGITTIMTEDISKDKEGLFTLTGIRIPDNVTPQPGIYIKDGKKIVIK